MSVVCPPLVGFASPLVWLGFIVFVLVMLALDLGVFHRRAHAVSVTEALRWSAVWVALSALFGLGLWWWAGAQTALEFTAGYVLEKALSVDNLFVMLAIMRSFKVPSAAQHRVLLWGVLGALVMRALLIATGSALLSLGAPVLWVFGAILLFAAMKLLQKESDEVREGMVERVVRNLVPVTEGFHGTRFFAKQNGQRLATPLLLALVSIEGADAVFAVDSIPAVFSVTREPFIVFSSNILAVLGLRSLFFVLAGALDRFHLLRFGLAGVLAFVGAKLLLGSVLHVPVGLSLAVIIGVLLVSVLASLRFPRRVVEMPVSSSALNPLKR